MLRRSTRQRASPAGFGRAMLVASSRVFAPTLQYAARMTGRGPSLPVERAESCPVMFGSPRSRQPLGAASTATDAAPNSASKLTTTMSLGDDSAPECRLRRVIGRVQKHVRNLPVRDGKNLDVVGVQGVSEALTDHLRPNEH